MQALIALLPLVVGFATDPLAASAQPSPPNVVVILADDLGWTDVACNGSRSYETPNLDRLAGQGMRFTNAYSACTVCSPTRAAILTGKYPARLHLTDWIHGHERRDAKLLIPEWTHALAFEETTVAEALKPRGYATASIGKWHLGDGPERGPTHHGFDVNVAGTGKGHPPSYFAPYDIATLSDGPEGESLTERLATEACKFIDENRERPFFLYLPHFAVHTPLQAKPDQIERARRRIPADSMQRNATYAAMVHSLDASIGTVLKCLDDHDLARKTLVIFTSDNGGLTLRETTSNAPLRAGKGSSYEGGVRVPFIARWPGVISPGTTCDEAIISNDVYATVLEAADVSGDADHSRPVDGLSLVPLFRDPSAQLRRDAIFWHYPHYHPGGATPYSAIRKREWKLIEFFEDNHVELYNLADDIGESKNLAAIHADTTKELHDRLRAWRADVGAQLPRQNPDFALAKPSR